MRQKNSPREDVAQRRRALLEKVKPLTLGHLAKSGVERIEAECEWCRHAALVEIAPLIAREGSAALFRNIASRLRCSVCGCNRIEAWPIRPGRETPRRRSSALPPLAECRALLAAMPIDVKARRVDQNACPYRKIHLSKTRSGTSCTQAFNLAHWLIPDGNWRISRPI